MCHVSTYIRELGVKGSNFGGRAFTNADENRAGKSPTLKGNDKQSSLKYMMMLMPRAESVV